jgi:hypothetical protein
MNINFLVTLCVLVISLMVMMPVGVAWKWDTHSNIVEQVYYDLPNDVQTKLSMKSMDDGSNDPDQKFHDTRSHSFPSSYSRAIEWLDKGKAAYHDGDYDYASYCFGVASHYISDSFSAPHCVSGEESDMHTKYEEQGILLKPKITYNSTSIYESMDQGHRQGSMDWETWNGSFSSGIVQNDLNNAASASYSAIRNAIST